MGYETNESKTLKALNSLGKEASTMQMSKITNFKYKRVSEYLQILGRKGLVSRRRVYSRVNGITSFITFYKINDKDKHALARVKYWIKHF